jgi:hypothetical protein
VARGDPDPQHHRPDSEPQRGLRSTASPSILACVGSGAVTSRRGALQARPGLRGLSPGASRTTMPSWPLSSVGWVRRPAGRPAHRWLFETSTSTDGITPSDRQVRGEHRAVQSHWYRARAVRDRWRRECLSCPLVPASLAGTALVSVLGRRSGPGRGSDARLGLYAPGGDRVGQCRVVAFDLVGVGLAEVGHGLVELV